MKRINKFDNFDKLNEGKLSKEYIENYLEKNLKSEENDILDNNDRYVLMSDVVKVVNDLFEERDKGFFSRRKKQEYGGLTEGPERANTKNVTSPRPNIMPAPQGRVTKNSEVLIEEQPYKTSQFDQEQYRVFIKTPTKHYYIGDIRQFPDDEKYIGKYIGYLNLDRIIEQEPEYKLIQLNPKQMKIVDRELNSNYLSSNLMDEPIIYKDKLRRNYNIRL